MRQMAFEFLLAFLLIFIFGQVDITTTVFIFSRTVQIQSGTALMITNLQMTLALPFYIFTCA